MTNLYITADQVGGWSGGSQVTFNESQALASLGPCEVWGRDHFEKHVHADMFSNESEPWRLDKFASYLTLLGGYLRNEKDKLTDWIKFAHFYAGTFSETVKTLKDRGVKISYTAAAHDVEVSRREHQLLGLDFHYPHLTDPELWKRYLAGYSAADVLICPSRYSADVMRKFGCTNRIEIIPHGCNLPEKVVGLPDRFTVGYLGAIGPDKGLRYLIEAWGKLAYKDATLVIAGRDSTHPFVQQMIHQWGGNANFNLLGWVEDVSTFYNSLSLYVQPSVTEGFGIEVLEAMVHGRPVVCSEGAGACDLIQASPVRRCSADDLADRISLWREAIEFNDINAQPRVYRAIAEKYTWDKIRLRYVNLWKELLK